MKMDIYCPRLSMQKGFTKLFNTIVTSTIWREDDKTRIVWITLLAICDRYGDVSASIPGLASVANVSIEETEKAIANLMSPDEYSRTKDHEGRRIKEIDGGWHVYNYGKYRDMLNAEERKQYKALKEQERRDRLKQNVDKRGQKWTNVDSRGQRGHNAECREQRAEANKDIGTKGSSPTLKFPNGLTDSEWLATLKTDPVYKGIDVGREHGKMVNWCKAHNKAPTRRRFINWLNRADLPMSGTPNTYQKPKEAAPVYAKAPPPQPPLTPEEIERNKKLSSQMVNDLKKKMQP